MNILDAYPMEAGRYSFNFCKGYNRRLFANHNQYLPESSYFRFFLIYFHLLFLPADISVIFDGYINLSQPLLPIPQEVLAAFIYICQHLLKKFRPAADQFTLVVQKTAEYFTRLKQILNLCISANIRREARRFHLLSINSSF